MGGRAGTVSLVHFGFSSGSQSNFLCAAAAVREGETPRRQTGPYVQSSSLDAS